MALLLATLLTACAPAPAELRVKRVLTLTEPETGAHHHATVALGPDGGFLLAYNESFGGPGDAWARPYDVDGDPLGDPVQVNELSEYGGKPDVVATDDGFVITWDDDGAAVWLRTFDADGQPRGPSIEVSAGEEAREAPDVAAWPDGSGVVVFSVGTGSQQVQAFDADGLPTGEPSHLDGVGRTTPDVAVRGGDFVTAWTTWIDPEQPEDTPYALHLGLHPDAGAPSAWRVDAGGASWPSRPSLGIAEDGRIALAWRDKTERHGESDSAWVRFFAPDGAPTSPPILVAGGDANRPAVALRGDLALLVWEQTRDGDAEIGIHARLLDARTGLPLGEPRRISKKGGTRDQRPSLALRQDTDRLEALVTWETFDGFVSRGLEGRWVHLPSEEEP